MALAGVVLVANIVCLIVVPGTTAEVWVESLSLTIAAAAAAVTAFRPEWNRQYTYSRKQRKMVWKSKTTHPDVGSRRFLLMGMVALWLSMVNFGHAQYELHDANWTMVLFAIVILLTPILVVYIIWTEIRIMKLNGAYDHQKRRGRHSEDYND